MVIRKYLLIILLDYGVLLYQGLGMTGSMPLLMYALYVVVGASVNIIAAFIMDKVGRRPLFCKSLITLNSFEFIIQSNH